MQNQKRQLWILIGNPENRRADLFSNALPCGDRLIVFSYEELILSDAPFRIVSDRLREFSSYRWLVKIDSAGENAFVEHHFLSLGGYSGSYHSEDFGRFYPLSCWQKGFQCTIQTVEKALTQAAVGLGSNIFFLNGVDAINTMCDKLSCQTLLESCQVSVPTRLPSFSTFNDLHAFMLDTKTFQVFIKARYGSSASGIAALRVHPDGKRLVARSTLARDSAGYFFNSLDVQTYSNIQDVKRLFDVIQVQEGYCEKWLPKPTLNGLSFDLRIAVIGKKAQQFVARCSTGPMTNLHLGNQRGHLLDHPDGEAILHNARKIAEEASQCLPEAGCIGVDVIADTEKAYVLELNAFGDLLPGVFHNGKSTYASQVEVMQCA